MIAFPYILLVLVFFIRHYSSNVIRIYKKSEKLFIYFILWIFFSFRGFIFTDCFGYASFFYGVPNLIEIIKTGYLKYTWWEPGYVCYCGLIKLFTNDWLVFQIIDSTIDLILLHKSLEYFDSERALNFVIFLAMSGMIAFIDLFRNIKSILLFFYALRFVKERKFIQYYMVCFVALSFHKSSVFYFLCYPFLLNPIKKQKYILLGVVVFLVGLISRPMLLFINTTIGSFLPQRFQTAVNSYILTENSMSLARVMSLGVIEKILTFCLIILNYEKIQTDKNGQIMMKLFLLYFSSYFLLFGFNEVSNRVSMLFVFSYWCLIPLIIQKQTKQQQLIYVICILSYCILKISLYKQPIQKYENWLIGASSYTERQVYNNTYQ